MSGENASWIFSHGGHLSLAFGDHIRVCLTAFEPSGLKNVIRFLIESMKTTDPSISRG